MNAEGHIQIRQKIEHYWKILQMILQISMELISMGMNGIQKSRNRSEKAMIRRKYESNAIVLNVFLYFGSVL